MPHQAARIDPQNTGYLLPPHGPSPTRDPSFHQLLPTPLPRSPSPRRGMAHSPSSRPEPFAPAGDDRKKRCAPSGTPTTGNSRLRAQNSAGSEVRDKTDFGSNPR